MAKPTNTEELRMIIPKHLEAYKHLSALPERTLGQYGVKDCLDACIIQSAANGRPVLKLLLTRQPDSLTMGLGEAKNLQDFLNQIL